MGSVYIHTTPSGKKYIGITSKIPQYRGGHNGEKYKRTGHHRYFSNAIDKYGGNNIKHEIILENVSESEAKYAERYLIKGYKSYNLCYNQTDGGDGTCGFSKTPGNKGIPCSDETKLKISLSNTGKESYGKGRHLPKETREKMSATRIRKNIKTNPVGSMQKVNVYKDDVLIKTCDSVKEASNLIGAVYEYTSKCLTHNKLCKKYKLEYA